MWYAAITHYVCPDANYQCCAIFLTIIWDETTRNILKGNIPNIFFSPTSTLLLVRQFLQQQSIVLKLKICSCKII